MRRTVGGRPAAPPATAAPAPVRGNQIFHQLKADVLRGDASTFFPQVSPQPLDRQALEARLLMLAESYLDAGSFEPFSASIYSFLALALFPESIAARRVRSRSLLEAGQGAVFPFCRESSARGGALAALEVLQSGPDDLFADVECAKIWSRACRILGRDREAEEVMVWSMENVAGSSSISVAAANNHSGKAPPVSTSSSRQEAITFLDLGDIARSHHRMEDAYRHYQHARSKDPYNWRAWTSLCELGTAPMAFAAFAETMCDHDASSFLDAAIVALGGTPSSQAEAHLQSASSDSNATSSIHQRSGAGSQQPSHQRPGTRPTAGAVSSGASTATAKRVKSGAITNGNAAVSRNTNAGRTAAAFGIENSGTSNSTAKRSAPPLTRTLSQARTNERPPSSLSNTSGGPEKVKERDEQQQPAINGKDTLRRSTRSAANSPQARRTMGSRTNTTINANASRTRTSVSAGRSTPAASSSRSRSARPGPDPTSSESESVHGPRRPNLTTQQSAPSFSHGPFTLTVVDDVAQSIRQAALTKAAELAAKWRTVDSELLKYLRLLGGVYKDALDFKGDKILRTMGAPVASGLSKHAMDSLLDTTEVGLLIARVHHDMAQYRESEQCFESVMRSHRCVVQSMDIYSLVLYHLNRQDELSALAQELLNIDPEALETHLTIGNLFSLNSSPSIALRSFRRACLRAPSYAYSFTLAGHECLALSQPLKALRFFRQAVRVNRRHWNGWSGIGAILSNEGRWQDAKFALNHACSLNSSNAGLHEVLAVVQEMLGERTAALESYNKAVTLNPKSASASLRKAELLWSLNRLEAAHAALLQAVALAPNEARAHLLLAESYMRKGGGSFAPLSKSKRGAAAAGDEGAHQGIDMAGSDFRAKAVGDSVAPGRYQDEIAKHLAIAVDLEPGISRRVKAMTEGIGATLRGQSRSATAHAMPGADFHHAAAALGVPDRSIGSSFSGVDESRHLYSATGDSAAYESYDVDGMVSGGGGGGEEVMQRGEDSAAAAAAAAAYMLEDSMGVLQDPSEGGHDEDDGDEEEEEERHSNSGDDADEVEGEEEEMEDEGDAGEEADRGESEEERDEDDVDMGSEGDGQRGQHAAHLEAEESGMGEEMSIE